MFKLWSEKNNDAKNLLDPAIGLRDWDEVPKEEKEKIWHHLKFWFINDKNNRTFISILGLNDIHKYRSYGVRCLKDPSSVNAILDFGDIFSHNEQHVVVELLSLYGRAILSERKSKTGNIYESYYQTKEEYEKVLNKWRFAEFDNFSEIVNDIFEQFSINLILTRSGFIFRQDAKIINEIYIPVLNFLSLPKWNDVNRELIDAFKAYQIKTEEGYSSCITHTISSLEAFLQIIVNGEIGDCKGIKYFIKEAQDKGLIPNDKFSGEIFKNIDIILMAERGKTGDAHPKKEYANEKNARLVLNLTMIFIQHCMQS